MKGASEIRQLILTEETMREVIYNTYVIKYICDKVFEV